MTNADIEVQVNGDLVLVTVARQVVIQLTPDLARRIADALYASADDAEGM